MAKQKIKKSTQVAMGGLISALSIVIMFLTGLIPFGEYAFPAFAGLVLISIVVDVNFKTAMVVYVAVSILGLFVVPVKESAILFLFFFGFYPSIYLQLNRIKSKPLKVIVKFLIFNVCVITAYLIFINLFSSPEEFMEFGRYTAYIMLALGNIFFVIYDLAVKSSYFLYIYKIRPKVIKKIK